MKMPHPPPLPRVMKMPRNEDATSLHDADAAAEPCAMKIPHSRVMRMRRDEDATSLHGEGAKSPLPLPAAQRPQPGTTFCYFLM
mmetsp:Transcript_10662/g.29231  ORF Transcript_10662/g.29231 Transcript_10662/m.29231 type:complete len:84 (+) Transcript_10662:577-828(+)